MAFVFCFFFHLKIGRRGRFVRNRKGGINLLYGGFVYRKKAEYKNTTNWVCAKAPARDSNNRLIACYGRCVTDEGNRVRLSKKGHNHSPLEIEFLEDSKTEYLDSKSDYFDSKSDYLNTLSFDTDCDEVNLS